MIQLGSAGADATAVVGGMVIFVSGMVTGCGEGLIRRNAATRITTTMMPAMMSQGVRELFSFKTIRHVGQTVRLDSIDAPQFGQVFFTMYSDCFIS
jgi:hypothetical protein